MRLLALAALVLPLAACDSTPQSVTIGPRVDARLAARWPTAAPARQAVFSRDGQLAAFSDASGTITVRDTRNWSIVRQLYHPNGAASLAFTRGGTALLSGGYDGAIRFWDLRTGKQTGALKADSKTVWRWTFLRTDLAWQRRVRTLSFASGT